MIKIKKISVLICALLLTLSSKAQDIKIENSSIKHVGDSIIIHFDVEVESLALNYKLDITPVIYNGTFAKKLKSIVYGSYVKDVVDCRKDRRLHDVIYIRKREVVRYSITVPIEIWMNDFSLRADIMLEAYGVAHALPSVLISENNEHVNTKMLKPIYEKEVEKAYEHNIEQGIRANFSFVQQLPISKSLGVDFKNHREQGIAIYFKQGSTKIDDLYNGNYKNLQKIKDAIRLIDSIPNIELSKITILGATSPEGSHSLNMKLAENRASRLISYLKDIDRNKLDIYNIGEDWEGLKELVEKLKMPYYKEVLHIIDNNSIFEGREKKLMDLAGGVPYRYMSKHYFSKLRSASYIQIFYELTSNDELKIQQDAVDLIAQKRYESALDMLNTLQVSTSIDNLKGVCYMMLGDVRSAQGLFQRAIDNGSKHAIENLKKLNL